MGVKLGGGKLACDELEAGRELLKQESTPSRSFFTEGGGRGRRGPEAKLFEHRQLKSGF